MTQTAFLRKADLKTKTEIQDIINKLGYDFKFLDEFENLTEVDGLNCSIEGYETYFEVFNDSSAEILQDNDWINSDITNQDHAISFVWGADFAAGASIGLICIGLIESSNALIYYLDDEMKYSKKMLLDDTPQFLNELKKEKPTKLKIQIIQQNNDEDSTTFWGKLKNIFK